MTALQRERSVTYGRHTTAPGSERPFEASEITQNSIADTKKYPLHFSGSCHESLA